MVNLAPNNLSVVDGVILEDGVWILVVVVSTFLLFCLVLITSRCVLSSLTFSFLSVRKSATTLYLLVNLSVSSSAFFPVKV